MTTAHTTRAGPGYTHTTADEFMKSVHFGVIENILILQVHLLREVADLELAREQALGVVAGINHLIAITDAGGYRS